VTVHLSERFSALLQEHRQGASESEIAKAVLKLSDFYATHPGAPTPWEEPSTALAYLNYFLPLNYARLQGTFNELKRFVPADQIAEVWDFGSGSGATHQALEDQTWLGGVDLVCVERSHKAIEKHRALIDKSFRFRAQFGAPSRAPRSRSLAVFSYSFLEMVASLPDLKRFDHVLILEPSTRETSRQLMSFRDEAMEMGFQILAPCTHLQACPLLVESERDFCHQRVEFAAPEWWRAMEQHLPMQNRTLTYSYLLLSRTVAPLNKWQARVIGDSLEERGKTRQMICRGPKREFISWLHRHGKPERIPHGALLVDVSASEPKSNELRVPAQTQLAWEDEVMDH
jgi:ribosomal protein RSM22 (predicted rRNA methylase)